MATQQVPDGVRSRQPRLVPRVAAALALVVLLLLAWPVWSMAQARLAEETSVAARRVVAGCEGAHGRTFVYHVTLLAHGGAVCSALVRQDTFYSYVMGRDNPGHWLRYDCEVSTPRDSPYCMERALGGPVTWGLLVGPPDADVQKLSTTGRL